MAWSYSEILRCFKCQKSHFFRIEYPQLSHDKNNVITIDSLKIREKEKYGVEDSSECCECTKYTTNRKKEELNEKKHS